MENDEQLDKYLEIKETVPTLRYVIVLEREGLEAFSDPKVIFLEDLYVQGNELAKLKPGYFETLIADVQPEHVRMLIYTSGTTGKPKGAMISHKNSLFQMNALSLQMNVRESDDVLCFLPLCHVAERLFSVEMQLAAGFCVNFVESTETVFENLQEVSPQIFFAVPRVWEKIYSRVQMMRNEATALGRWLFDCAIRAGQKKSEFHGREPGHWCLKLSSYIGYYLWDALVLRNLRAMLGLNRMRRANTGAAPISPELLAWYAAIGVPIFEGYGQTECTGVATFNQASANRLGTVGQTILGASVRIADDGEIQLNGPHQFKGYLNQPEKTKETFTSDGWLKTGDIGELDEQGFLSITGRIKDIIITAGGKNITPAEIENSLKFSPYISDAVVIGDRRKFLTALIMLDQDNVEYYAQEHRISFVDFGSLCREEDIISLIQLEMDKVNQQFARVEQIKAFRLIDVILTAEDEELTPTMKLKRSYVEKKYKCLIDEMYPNA